MYTVVASTRSSTLLNRVARGCRFPRSPPPPGPRPRAAPPRRGARCSPGRRAAASSRCEMKETRRARREDHVRGAPVLAHLPVHPARDAQVARARAPSRSTGRAQAKVSKPLARVCCTSLRWMSRAVTSLKQVSPKMRRARPRASCAPREPLGRSPAPARPRSAPPRSRAGRRMGRPVAIERGGGLEEDERLRRHRLAHLLRVLAVVLPDRAPPSRPPRAPAAASPSSASGSPRRGWRARPRRPREQRAPAAPPSTRPCRTCRRASG